MKKEIESTLEWIVVLVKKYTIPVFIVVALWYGIKRAWFWTVMPIMCLVFLQQIALVMDITWVGKLTLSGITVSWVFVFSLLKGLGGLIFEKD